MAHLCLDAVPAWSFPEHKHPKERFSNRFYHSFKASKADCKISIKETICCILGCKIELHLFFLQHDCAVN